MGTLSGIYMYNGSVCIGPLKTYFASMRNTEGVGRTLAISWKLYVGYLIKNRCSQVLSYKGHVFAENEAP
jgi:hypothetical protein